MFKPLNKDVDRYKIIYECYRGGVYPASSCLKISGSYGNLPHCFIVREVKKYFLNIFSQFPDSGENVTVRTCAVDGGTLTADTEIVRLSHCGAFYLDER